MFPSMHSLRILHCGYRSLIISIAFGAPSKNQKDNALFHVPLPEFQDIVRTKPLSDSHSIRWKCLVPFRAVLKRDNQFFCLRTIMDFSAN